MKTQREISMPPEKTDSNNSSLPPGKGRLSPSARLRFAYDKERVRLTGVRAFMKVLPAATGHTVTKGAAGTWLELLDKDGRVLWSKGLGPAMRFDLELHQGTKKGSFTRTPNPDASGFFEVIVPLLPKVTGARLWTPPLRPDASHLPAEERLLLVIDVEKGTWKEAK